LATIDREGLTGDEIGMTTAQVGNQMRDLGWVPESFEWRREASCLKKLGRVLASTAGLDDAGGDGVDANAML